MLSKILSPLTTSTSLGVVLRYVLTIISSIVAILAILGVLTPDQVTAITQKISAISDQLPALLAALAGLVAIFIPTYAAITKSSSNKAAEAAKQIDASIPADHPVIIQTPPGQQDIIVTPKS